MNWGDINVMSKAGVNWSDLDVMSKAGVNWADMDVLSKAGVNWTGIRALSEGYSEPLDDGKQRVFGYTPNYLKVACVISAGVSVENKTLMTRLLAVGEEYMHGELV